MSNERPGKVKICGLWKRETQYGKSLSGKINDYLWVNIDFVQPKNERDPIAYLSFSQATPKNQQNKYPPKPQASAPRPPPKQTPPPNEEPWSEQEYAPSNNDDSLPF